MTSLVLVTTCSFWYSALSVNGGRARARCVVKHFVVNFYSFFSVVVSAARCASFYCGVSAGPTFCGRRLVPFSSPHGRHGREPGPGFEPFFEPGGYTPEPMCVE